MKNMDNSMRLVPFGKYKGQPVEVMQMDTGYCEWLSTQDWFRERYANVYQQVIINNFTEASETPEHNKLQMLFLDKDFYRKIESLLPVDPYSIFKRQIVNAVTEIKGQIMSEENLLESYRRELQIKEHYRSEEKRKEKLAEFANVAPNTLEYWRIEKTLKYLLSYSDEAAQKEISELEDRIKGQIEKIEELKKQHNTIVLDRNNKAKYSYDVKTVEFEHSGWDVFVGLKYKCGIDIKTKFTSETEDCYEERYIEIKPCLGDDFPAVLRQMKANSKKIGGTRILLIDEFSAVGATLEQVKQTFLLSDIYLIKLSDITEDIVCQTE